MRTSEVETNEQTYPVDVDQVAQPRRLTKHSWIILGAAAGALAITAAVAVPVIAVHIAHSNALDELTISENTLMAARDEYVVAQQEVFDASTGAVIVYSNSSALMSIIRPELLADGGTLDTLMVSLTDLSESASLTIAGSTVTAPELVAAPEASIGASPATVEAIRELTEANFAQAETFERDTDAAWDAVADIDKTTEAVDQATEDMAHSGAEFGSQVTGFEKASGDQQAALARAVDGLGNYNAPALERFNAYNAAYDAVKASHDEAVAAELRAAEKAAAEAQRQQQGSNGGGLYTNRGSSNSGSSSSDSSNAGSYNGGSSNGGGGGSLNAGGSSNSGGSNTGGGSSNTGGGYIDPNANKMPAKFQTGALYVGYSARCFFYASHTVGYGGTSTSAGSMDALGVSWSATVDGPTVIYYICG